MTRSRFAALGVATRRAITVRRLKAAGLSVSESKLLDECPACHYHEVSAENPTQTTSRWFTCNRCKHWWAAPACKRAAFPAIARVS